MSPLQDWLRRQAQRSRPLYAVLRGVKAGVRALAAGPPLPRDATRARIEPAGALPPFSVGTAARVRVTVTNASPHAWPGGGRLAVSYHWHRAGGGVWGFDGGRTPLPTRLEPGQSTSVECVVRPPNTPAPYTLELDLVEGRDRWFAARGSRTLRQDVVVAGLQPDALDEIDYEQVYGAADLTKDFWNVVGPASAEEFRQLGRGKLEMLKAEGLAPGSRLLDVGCGTGTLAGPALEFLSDEGLYYGTDLSEKAVEYCRQHYRRANFRFAKNGMTTIPLDGPRFDFIVFFSVFTHTYPAETRELLSEAARLLDEGGSIVADVFETDIEGDSLGTRAMLVLPRGLFLAMAADLGLEAREISAFSWDPAGPRRIDRVLRRLTRRAPGA
jgi:SAM-dependent methyltransferase